MHKRIRPGTRRSLGRPNFLVSGGSTALASLLLILCVLVSGCADSRISIDALRDHEAKARAIEPRQIDTQQLSLTEIKEYTVGKGDVLALDLLGLQSEYSLDEVLARVHDDGTITLPLVGKVQVAGFELGHVEEVIRKAYIPDYVKNLAVYVEVANANMTTVVVVGAAAQPGVVTLLRNELNVLYALARSGGFGPGSSGRVQLRPIRSDRELLSFDLTDINDLRRALLAPPLESGDLIFVEASEPPAVYVTGLVNSAGPVAIPENGSLSVLRAIAATGGIREYMKVKEATLIRRLTNGEQVHVKLELGEMLAGKVEDVELQAGDILSIAHTPATFIQDWFIRNVIFGPTSIGVRYDPLAQRNASRALSNRFLGGGSLQSSIRASLGSAIPNILIPPVPVPTQP